MIDVNSIPYDIYHRYSLVEDFGFTSFSPQSKVSDCIIVKCSGRSSCMSPVYNVPDKGVEEFIRCINENKIEKAIVIMDNISFLKRCPTLRHLSIIPSNEAGEGFDFSPLYDLPEIKSLHCQTIYGEREQYISKVDFSEFKELVALNLQVTKGTLNYNKVETLKTMGVSGFKSKSEGLTDLFCSPNLDTLWLLFCSVPSLDGIETAKEMTHLYLDDIRNLSDISSLSKIGETLRELRIDNCSKITDFSVLNSLENVEDLTLKGKNTLKDLSFLKRMKHLKCFQFEMNVEDGDLSACMDIDGAVYVKNRKHYNIKDKDLPKGTCNFSPDQREIWRRY